MIIFYLVMEEVLEKGIESHIIPVLQRDPLNPDGEGLMMMMMMMMMMIVTGGVFHFMGVVIE